jgi:predicted short-subunit dehydrogenase-like oxidoreductase (DUF2520 family)
MLRMNNEIARGHTSVTAFCYGPLQGQNLLSFVVGIALNYLVTLLDLAIRRIGEAGINRQNAFNLLKSLIEEKLSNIEKAGAQKALTGLITRGDIKTVEKHIKDIGFNRPQAFLRIKRLIFLPLIFQRPVI